MKPGDFAEIYKRATTSELLEVVENQQSYQLMAVEAAKAELALRQVSGVELEQARETALLVQQIRVKRYERFETVANQFKSTATSAIQVLRPNQTQPNPADDLVKVITYVFGFIFLFQLYNQLSFFVRYFEFARFIDLVPLVIFFLAIFSFWRLKPIGWILLVYCIIYFAVPPLFIIAYNLWWYLIDDVSNLYPAAFLLSSLLQILFYGAALYAMLRPGVRNIFSIRRRTPVETVVISFLISAAIFGVSQLG